MSILVGGMKMPRNCIECPLQFGGICYVQPPEIDDPFVAETIDEAEKGRTNWCPLIEIPPHGRLIDADEISKHKYATIPPYRKEYSDGKPKSEDEVIAFKFGWNDAIDAIVANAPTIIEAESGGI